MIRDAAAQDCARRILEAAAPAILSDELVNLAATLIKIAVQTDETQALNENLRRQLDDLKVSS